MGKRTNTARWTGTRWRIDVQKNGVRRCFYAATPGRNGQREANAKADKWLDADIIPTRAKVGASFKEYQAADALTVGTSYQKQTEYFAKNWILPALGNKRIDTLCDGDLQTVLDKATAAGLSRKTIQGIYAAMTRFLKYCRKHKLTAYRPEEVTVPASARLKGKQVLQPADLVKLFNCDTYGYYARRVKEPYIHAYRFQVLTGLRPGELRGLKREDVHGHRVDVVRAVNDYGETTRGKNDNAVRSFMLSDLAFQELQQQLEQEPDAPFIFDLPSSQVYGKHWKRFCNDNGIRHVSPYELRHTFVSAVKRLPVSELKPLVGHSQDMDTFGVYGHALDGEAEQAANDINGIFTKLLTAKK